MRIHPEGKPVIGWSLLVLAVFNGMLVLTAPTLAWAPLLLISIFLAVFIVRFFRSPLRPVPPLTANQILSPADGTVVVVEEVDETEFFKDRRIQISIFMSPLNVHLNRVPISGEVTYYKYHPGKYLVAWHPKASTDNEMATMVIKQNDQELLIRQIAGAMARRIITYITPNQTVTQGAELGFIRFGSRVDVLLPLTADIQVKVGQKVKGNVDVLATF
jgi:phosphatidylserine decarboxylase